jgi:hypothetical protein
VSQVKTRFTEPTSAVGQDDSYPGRQHDPGVGRERSEASHTARATVGLTGVLDCESVGPAAVNARTAVRFVEDCRRCDPIVVFDGSRPHKV